MGWGFYRAQALVHSCDWSIDFSATIRLLDLLSLTLSFSGCAPACWCLY
uniref:Uncharacterized protein n=1 Tax=Arundo donax TaxID=35708 RepID=A0A0A9HUQ8_ARUDO